MIRPPFTLLILKNGRHPVTVRITAFTLFLFFIAFPMLSLGFGIGLSYLFRHSSEPPKSQNSSPAPISGAGPKHAAGITFQNGDGGDSLRAAIGSFFSSRIAGGGLEISITPTNVPSGETCYIWAILNPSHDSGDMIIHPRSPVFRGMPVDYRNGVPFLSAREKKCTFVMESIPDALTITGIRILIYSTDGGILADGQYAVGQQVRM